MNELKHFGWQIILIQLLVKHKSVIDNINFHNWRRT